MRKFMILCLFASAAGPALARPDAADQLRTGRADRHERAEVRNSGGDERRVLRSEQPRSDEQPSQARSSSDFTQVPVRTGSEVERPTRSAFGSGWGDARRSAPQQRRILGDADSRESNDSVRNWRSDRRADHTRGVGSAGPQGWAREPRADDPREDRFAGRMPGRLEVSRTPREGTQPPARIARDGRDGSFDRNHWRGDWRSDRRFDWRSHRDRNRSTFRIGVYYDPFGWNYRRYHVGWRMWPSYYRSNYWLSDPWMYRLPPAYPGTRWIRYHGDALLVDIWDGEVIDVIHDFFW